MWKAYGKSLFRKRNSIEVGEYFIQGEKEKIRRYISIYIYIYVYKARRVGSKYKRTYICATRSDQFHRVEKKTRVERFNTIRIELVG